jgi:hypothetical protein
MRSSLIRSLNMSPHYFTEENVKVVRIIFHERKMLETILLSHIYLILLSMISTVRYMNKIG